MRFAPNRFAATTSTLIALLTGGAMAQNDKPPNTMGNVLNNQGIITQGQSGNNTLIQGALPRRLGEQDKAQILARIAKTRKISIMVQMGDSDAADLSAEIKSFLVSSGYSVQGPDFAMMFGPNGSPRGVNINLNEDKPSEPVQITVGIR
jgi:hypothetical protein